MYTAQNKHKRLNIQDELKAETISFQLSFLTLKCKPILALECKDLIFVADCALDKK
jgi:hypothetical protein